jgi:hypothetical protein
VPDEASKSRDNGKIALLTQLAASGDNWVKLAIMVLIGISGIGNFINTRQTGYQVSRLSKEEAEQIKKEIHEMHANQDVFLNNARLINEMNRMMYEIKFRLEQREHPISSDSQ